MKNAFLVALMLALWGAAPAFAEPSATPADQSLAPSSSSAQRYVAEIVDSMFVVGPAEFFAVELPPDPPGARAVHLIGTITVTFKPCWEGRDPPPSYQGARNVSPNGTGFGETIKKKSKVIKRTIGPLAAGASISDSFSQKLALVGTYYLIAVADHNGQIWETNESNNFQSVKITVLSGPS